MAGIDFPKMENRAPEIFISLHLIVKLAATDDKRRNVSGQAKKTAMEKQTVIINGNNFSDLEGFYVEIDRVLTKNLDWKTGHNLNAFNDLLRGGFGVHEYEEPIKIIWKDFSESKKRLGKDLIEKLLEIIAEHDYIEFEIETGEWTFKKILVRLIAYPFCIFIIVLGISAILQPVTNKSIGAGLGGIVIAITYLYSDIKILISKNREEKRPNR